MNSLPHHREAIDLIDEKILELLTARAEHVLAIGEIKKKDGLPVWVPERERVIYERLKQLNKGKLPNSAIRNIFREIISASIALEQVVEVGYFGLAGSFSNLAAVKRFGSSAKLIPLGGVRDIFEGVEKGRVNYGVIPIENTIEGVVNHSIDMFMDTSLFIVGEIFVEISQNLLNKTGRASDIKHIYSHPHAIAQCRNWLYKNMTSIPVSAAESTAQAAEMARDDETFAAIGSEMAEIVYDLRIIEKHIEDEPLNFTRFLVIGKNEMKPTGNDTTSIMFGIKDEAGSLCDILEIFKKGDANMSKLESRPSKQKAWEYLFYANIDGHKDDKKLNNVLDELRKNVAILKVLGSYPKGEL